MNENKSVIEGMKGELAELKDELSRQRKKGIDVFIAQLKIAALPSKLKMAEATQTAKDAAAAQRLIDEVGAELKASSESPEENFKNNQQAFYKIIDYIERAKEAAGHGKKEEAAVLYTYVQEHYKALSPEQKKQILPECQKLAQQLKS